MCIETHLNASLYVLYPLKVHIYYYYIFSPFDAVENDRICTCSAQMKCKCGEYNNEYNNNILQYRTHNIAPRARLYTPPSIQRGFIYYNII